MSGAIATVHELQTYVSEAKSAAQRLALHFCEDLNGSTSSTSRFQLQECFKLFAEFFDKVDQVRVVRVKLFTALILESEMTKKSRIFLLFLIFRRMNKEKSRKRGQLLAAKPRRRKPWLLHLRQTLQGNHHQKL